MRRANKQEGRGERIPEGKEERRGRPKRVERRQWKGMTEKEYRKEKTEKRRQKKNTENETGVTMFPLTTLHEKVLRAKWHASTQINNTNITSDSSTDTQSTVPSSILVPDALDMYSSTSVLSFRPPSRSSGKGANGGEMRRHVPGTGGVCLGTGSIEYTTSGLGSKHSIHVYGEGRTELISFKPNEQGQRNLIRREEMDLSEQYTSTSASQFKGWKGVKAIRVKKPEDTNSSVGEKLESNSSNIASQNYVPIEGFKAKTSTKHNAKCFEAPQISQISKSKTENLPLIFGSDQEPYVTISRQQFTNRPAFFPDRPNGRLLGNNIEFGNDKNEWTASSKVNLPLADKVQCFKPATSDIRFGDATLNWTTTTKASFSPYQIPTVERENVVEKKSSGLRFGDDEVQYQSTLSAGFKNTEELWKTAPKKSFKVSDEKLSLGNDGGDYVSHTQSAFPVHPIRNQAQFKPASSNALNAHSADKTSYVSTSQESYQLKNAEFVAPAKPEVLMNISFGSDENTYSRTRSMYDKTWEHAILRDPINRPIKSNLQFGNPQLPEEMYILSGIGAKRFIPCT